ncbi:MAG: hypothetical protein J6D20_04565 [Clostridia bacterium]|nr:hypothetical protein [Clostridia bacterium]
MSNKNDNKSKNTTAPSGIQKAIPIILVGVALFIGVCFIFGGTGAFGNGVASILLGLFACGAYAVPLLLILHAVFFAEDMKKKSVLSRVIFSFIAVLIISSVDYAITGFGTEPVFDPVAFYETQSHGGFVGGIFSFCIAKLIGYVGLIILDVTAVVAYTIVFFGKKESTARRGILGFLQFFASGLAKAETKIKQDAENRKEAKAESKRQETERRHSEFLNDSFFDNDGNMDELSIRELGIHETKKKGRSESRPVLQTKVHNRSALSKEELEAELRQNERYTPADSDSRKKGTSFDFNISSQDKKSSNDASKVFFGATDKSFTEKQNQNYGIDENADSVFTKDFDPFDFATGEKLVAKASTKAQPAPTKQGGIGFVTPLSEVTEKSLAEQRRREEFEQRKRSIIESRNAAAKPNISPSAPTVQNTQNTQEAAATVTEKATVSENEAAVTESAKEKETVSAALVTASAASVKADDSVTMEFGSSKEIIEVPEEPKEEPEQITEPEPEITEEIPAPTAEDENIEEAYEQIAEMVLKNNPAYAVSANRSTFTTTVKGDDLTAAAAAHAESSDEQEEAKPKGNADTQAASFKPYTPPSPDESKISSTEEAILVTERTLITPDTESLDTSFLQKEIERYSDLPESDESVSEEDTPVQAPEAETEPEIAFPAVPLASEKEEEKETVFTFGDEAEEEEVSSEVSGDIEEIFGTPDEESSDDTDQEPIPPEEQNPEVIKQRAMFPFLDETNEESTVPEEKIEEIEAKCEAETLAEPAADTSFVQAENAEETNPNEEEVVKESEEDDEPPFDIDIKEDISAAAMAIVPAEEKPKKKDYSDYVFPPIELLHAVDEKANENISEEIQDNADKLIDTLASFGVTASIKGVDRGPRITRYEVVPAKGVKVSNIMNLADDIALNLAADGIRMEAPIPGKSAVGVEIPNKKSSIVRLRELIETDDFKALRSKTSVCMGKDVAGQPVFADVAKMPHALVAGATGMGKSVCINSLMLSILYKARPDEVKFIMIDPKQVEFTMYNGIPHLLVPVVTDVKQAAGTLMWAVEEMERRYGVLQEQCVRNIDAYNEKVASNPALGEPMSRIVIVIDEFAELIMQAKNPVESLIIRIAQKARAAGIHLIIGTQKPVKEVITGLIKSNIPSKLSCKVASNRDSILIFDAAGAEKLLDKGDMLIAFANSLKPQRVQCAFVADEEVEAVMDYLKQYSDDSCYDESVMEEIKRAADKCTKKGGGDRDDDDGDDSSYGEGYLNNKEFLDAVEIAVNTRKISTSLIQRKLSIGYGKAAKFIDVMEDMGIVGEANGSKPREVLLSADEWHEKLARTSYD